MFMVFTLFNLLVIVIVIASIIVTDCTKTIVIVTIGSFVK